MRPIAANKLIVNEGKSHTEILSMTVKYFITLFNEVKMNSKRYGADFIFMGKVNLDNGRNISFEKYDFHFSFSKTWKKAGS
ncbi:MAG: hypothetical protein ACERIH_11385 [Labilibaculum antarcticum]